MDRQEAIAKIVPILRAARLYHRHEVVGLDQIPKMGSALIVCNHSLATYDIVLLMLAIYDQLDRLPRPLVDRLFFRLPYLGELVAFLGGVQGSHLAAKNLLTAGEIVTVAPGGMREALRPSTQRYQIRWDQRLGFAKLAMNSGVPVILATCPKADDLYDVYPSYLTAWVYKTFKFPLFFARGLGPTPIPRPIKLVHYLSEPIDPPPLPENPDAQKKEIKRFHARLVRRMHQLIGSAIQKR